MITLSENEYHAMRCLTKFVVGMTFPNTTSALHAEDVWWIRYSACKELFGITAATLKKLTDKGLAERREVDGDYLSSGMYAKVQYRISPKHFADVYHDLLNEKIVAATESPSAYIH